MAKVNLTVIEICANCVQLFSLKHEINLFFATLVLDQHWHIQKIVWSPPFLIYCSRYRYCWIHGVFLHESLHLSARDAVSGMWGAPFQPTVSLDPTRYSRKTLGNYLKKTPSGVSDPDSFWIRIRITFVLYLALIQIQIKSFHDKHLKNLQLRIFFNNGPLLHLHIKRTVRLLFFPVFWGLFWGAWIRIGTPHLDPLTPGLETLDLTVKNQVKVWIKKVRHKYCFSRKKKADHNPPSPPFLSYQMMAVRGWLIIFLSLFFY